MTVIDSLTTVHSIIPNFEAKDKYDPKIIYIIYLIGYTFFMIEVEKKLLLTETETEKLIQGASFLGEKTFTDAYYDNENYDLTRNDLWLRTRDGRFELKVPLNEGKSAHERILDRYREFETDEEIRKELGITGRQTLEQDLRAQGYFPFSTIMTNRKKYKQGNFGIDLDVMDFGYKVVEIELMVEDDSQMEKAAEEIMDFAKENGFEIPSVGGKVVEFLSRYSPKHYQVLVESGVV
ncbi:MAG: CYTH domain-containing protein [Patescibacteria group bacterium]|nr:CYTH domain-containing protein [Patescibacteria group bacterium]